MENKFFPVPNKSCNEKNDRMKRRNEIPIFRINKKNFRNCCDEPDQVDAELFHPVL